ncbi:hypothetical protein HGRIS_005334 [Hohenbuehelia grisea]|uniref:F-box domain-containing protein n=1 Tax=Hohenbuehelia grisea TaxID=104357 RepID=A0ABR3JG78_9AGAR
MAEAFTYGRLDLPQEIIDIIVDYCHSGRETLLTCSLISRKWVTSSRYHLFLTVTIRLKPLNFNQFAFTIRSPLCTIRPFIQKMELCGFDDSRDALRRCSDKLGPMPGLWSLSIIDTFIREADTMDQLRRLCPWLVSLALVNVAFSLNPKIVTILGFEHSSELELGGLQFLHPCSLSQFRLSPSLRHLLIDLQDQGTVGWLVRHEEPFSIQKLTVTIQSMPGIKSAQSLIGVAMRNISELIVEIWEEALLGLLRMQDMKSLSQLTSITIITWVSAPSAWTFRNQLVHARRHLLLFSESPLEKITLSFRDKKEATGYVRFEDLVSVIDWPALDSIFQGPIGRSLSAIELGFPSYQLPLEKLLPSCAARGINLVSL